MKYLLDANVAILALGRDIPALSQRISECRMGDLGISSIAFAEVAWGSWNGKLPSLLRLDSFTRDVEVVAFDHLAAKYYAMLPFKRGSFDRLIAAHALSLNLTLITNNEIDFADIPDLKVENWTV